MLLDTVADSVALEVHASLGMLCVKGSAPCSALYIA